jgi:hypothetical protein
MRTFLVIMFIFILGVSMGYSYCEQHKHSYKENEAFDYGVRAGSYYYLRSYYKRVIADPRIIDMHDEFVGRLNRLNPDPEWYCEWGQYFEEEYGK